MRLQPLLTQPVLRRKFALAFVFLGRKVEVFESLNDARERVLAIVKRAKAGAKPSIALFSTKPAPEEEELLKTLTELTEDRVERYKF